MAGPMGVRSAERPDRADYRFPCGAAVELTLRDPPGPLKAATSPPAKASSFVAQIADDLVAEGRLISTSLLCASCDDVEFEQEVAAFGAALAEALLAPGLWTDG